MPRPSFPSLQESEIQAEHIRKIKAVLVACPVDQVVEYDEISQAVGFDIRLPTHRYMLYKAFKATNQEVGANFMNVKTVGYRRMPVEASPNLGNAARSAARKSFRKTQAKIVNAVQHTNYIAPSDLQRVNREINHLGILELMTRDVAAPQMPMFPAPPDPGISARQTADLMREALGRTK